MKNMNKQAEESVWGAPATLKGDENALSLRCLRLTLSEFVG